MWKWKHFDTLDGLLHFVNERELRADQFKVVNSSAPRRSGLYGSPMYLIYREEPDDPEEALVEAMDQAEIEEESAVEAAEEILHALETPERPRAID